MPSSPDNKKWLGKFFGYNVGGETPEEREARKQKSLLNKDNLGPLNSEKGPVLPNGPSLGRTANGSKNKSGKRSEPPQGN